MSNVKAKKQINTQGALINVLISLIAVILALIVGGIIIALLGVDPFKTYGAIFKGAFGTPQALTQSLTASVPMLLTGLAVAVTFKCSVFNIGAEGQLLFGAMAAAIVGAYVQAPFGIHLVLTLLAAMAGGAIWAFFPASLKHTRNVNIVISTIMFNYIAQFFVQYLALGPLDGGDGSNSTKKLFDSARLPNILPPKYGLNLGFVLAIIAIIVIYILMNKTTRGFEMKAVGLNPTSATVAGIDVAQNVFLAMLISGALAGLAGGIQVTGTLGRFTNGFSPNYGFNGIPVALMARNNPIGVFFSSLLLGCLRTGSLMMQSTVGVSKSFIDIIQGLIIIFLCAEAVIRFYLTNKKSEETVPAATTSEKEVK